MDSPNDQRLTRLVAQPLEDGQPSVPMTVGGVLGTGSSCVVRSVALPEGDLLAGKFFDDAEVAARETKMLQRLAGARNIVSIQGAYTCVPDARLQGSFRVTKRRTKAKRGQVLPEPEVTSQEIQPLHFILEERCECTLQPLIKSHSFTEAQAAFALASVLRGLTHMHALSLVHRDIKDANIMLADGGARVVLCDLELASELPAGQDTIPWSCGTPGFIAPEIHMVAAGGKKADVFSAGVVFFLLLTGCHPFLEETATETKLATLHRQLPSEPGGLLAGRTMASCALLTSMLRKSSGKRCDATDALNHEWFQFSDEVAWPYTASF